MADRRAEQREAEADGFYDAWRGWAPQPDLLGHEPEDYMRGYDEVAPPSKRRSVAPGGEA